MDSDPKGLFYLLAVLSFIGLMVAWFAFREGGVNEFDIEGRQSKFKQT